MQGFWRTSKNDVWTPPQPKLLAMAPWLMEKANTICPSAQSQGGSSLRKEFSPWVPWIQPPLPPPCLLLSSGTGSLNRGCLSETKAPGHAWPIAYLVTNDGRSHFSFPLEKCQTIRNHWLVSEQLIIGNTWLWERFTMFEQNWVSWLSSMREPYEHSTWLCNKWSTGKEGPQQKQSLSVYAFWIGRLWLNF